MQISANGIALEVEDHGSPQGEPLLLIMGLGMQLLGWHEDFVAALVARGFRVIRFDNRDIGLSQSFNGAGVPNLALASVRYALGLRVTSPYALSDMAADSAAVLDVLGIDRAHVCGASMGGMIAQRLAALHPQRVKSLTLMMTSSGSRRLPGPSLKVRGAMISRPKDQELASIVEHYVNLYGLIGSPAYPPGKDYLRERFTRSITRSYRPAGTARQMVAIAADGDRTPLLASLRPPTHVIHGAADPLVPVPAGRDLAARIPGATLDVIDGMGHDLPKELWPRFVAGIAGAAGRA
ncbi:MAG: alpha/beta fold hydrolase [Burkholderiales bacterium]|nr:alpha/beta fold hydrolase [Burkholderiales bacterium]